MATGGMTTGRWMLAAAALLVALVSLWQLEAMRGGLVSEQARVDRTPVTYRARPGSEGPVVVIAHGFAGSQQMMASFALTLAQSGYRVASFDFQGHGRNPEPMSGDVTVVEGTTALLVAETRAVIAAARGHWGLGPESPVALLGHSMASDVVIRAALAEGEGVAAVVAVSAYSEAVTATAPERLLVINGAGEPHLREAALRMLHQVAPTAGEGETARGPGEVVRRVVAAPWVEHVSVLSSGTALREARAWFDDAFGRAGSGPVEKAGPWVLALLTSLWLLFRALVPLIPASARQGGETAPSWRRQLGAGVLAGTAGAAAAWPVGALGLPVQGFGALAVHMAVFGAVLLAALGPAVRRGGGPLWPGLVLAAWGIGLFGLALDRYGASFWPVGPRWTAFALLLPGTIVTFRAERAALAGRGIGSALILRGSLFLSLCAMLLSGADERFVLFIALTVLLLFWLVLAPAGRWLADRAGPGAGALGLGLLLAWSWAASVPLFAAG